jgi:hypothetical protein
MNIGVLVAPLTSLGLVECAIYRVLPSALPPPRPNGSKRLEHTSDTTPICVDYKKGARPRRGSHQTPLSGAALPARQIPFARRPVPERRSDRPRASTRNLPPSDRARQRPRCGEHAAGDRPRHARRDAAANALIAVKDPQRHARVSARWLARWLEERNQATIDEAAFVTAALVGLGGAGHDARLRRTSGRGRSSV